MIKTAMLAVAVAVAGVSAGVARAEGPVAFEKHVLSREFFSEGAGVGDFNRDGKPDVTAGPWWYEGPAFTKKHAIYQGNALDPHKYSEDFFSWGVDVNGDGWDDVLTVGFPGDAAYWYENPRGEDRPWAKHLVADHVDDESPRFVEFIGGRKQLVYITAGRFGYAEPVKGKETEPWPFHPVSAKGPWQRFTHGLGVGDVNGDGRADLIFKDGWFEQPASLEGDPPWKLHPFQFAEAGAQMYVYDVNGDGKPDVITSWHAHQYGLVWWEQKATDDKGEIGWEKHVIMGRTPAENAQGVVFTEPHGVDLADIDGDGLKDIVTGKRWWAHGPNGDPEAMKPAVLYWFQLKRDAGKAEFVAHRIDDDSGVGTEVKVADLNGDGKPDIVVGNKKGTFVFIQKPAATAAAGGR